MKKKWFIILIIFTFGFVFWNTSVKADSGWDYDYDVGGSDWGSSWDSDWGSSSWDDDWSSSSWSSSYDDDGYHSSGSYSRTIGGDYTLANLFGTFFFGMLIFFVIFTLIIEKNRKIQRLMKQRTVDFSYYKDLNPEELKKFDPTLDIEKAKQEFFEIYKKLQIAWMEFDTETIKEITTDEMYNMYSSQLKTLSMKKQKNIMADITYEDAKIYEIKEEDEVLTLKVFLTVNCFDYVCDDKNNVVRGRKDKKVRISYSLTFIKSVVNNNQEKCPNCGALVDITSSEVCPYCRTLLVRTANKYVLSKKTNIWQEFIK